VKKYLIAGLLVWLPLAITIWVLLWLLGLMDGVFLAADHVAAVLPEGAARPSSSCATCPAWACWCWRGLLAHRRVRHQHLRPVVAAAVGPLLHRIPIVKSIYSSVKQVSDTLFSSSGNAFREAVLVQYPRQGSLDHRLRHRAPGGEAASTCRRDTSASTCRPRPTRPRASS
jgi:uncharacterized membrane protein